MADVKISALPAAVVLADTDEFALNSSGTNKKIAGLLLLPRDVVVAAATRIIASKLLAGDAQPAFRILGDGSLGWGPGGVTAPDVTLVRVAANALRANGVFQSTVGFNAAALASASVNAYTAYVAGDSQNRFLVQADGTIKWGPGGATVADTNLYRYTTGILKTDGSLRTFGNITAGDGNTGAVVLSASNSAIYFGTAGDTNLYRQAAGVLKTDGALYVMGADSSGIGLYVPGGLIYKSGAAGVGAYVSLAPGDSAFRFSIDHAGSHQWGPGNAAPDVSLYRAYAGALSLNGLLALSESSAGAGALATLVTGDPNYRFTVGADGKLIWGPGPTAGDSNLYRLAAGILKTDGQLYIGGTFVGGGQVYAQVPANQAGFIYNPVTGGGPAFISQLQSGANALFTFDSNGRLSWGPGGAGALDTNLYRVSANYLQTDDAFNVALDLSVYGDVFVGRADGKRLYFGSAFDTNLYRAAASVLKTDGAIATGSYGTSLPASPVDGQEFTLVDSITNPSYQWRFRYNASSVSAYKWEFVGGSPLLAFFGAQQGVVPVATWTSGAPPMTVPRAGEYRAGISANASLATNVLAQVGLTTDGVNPLASTPSLATFTGDVTINQSDIPLTLAASANLQHIYWNSVSNVLWGSRRTSLLPVRVS